jgi:CheY-like chemotaxis protein
MTRNAFVVSWDEDEAIDLASRLSDAGWVVALDHSGVGPTAWKRIKEGRPDLVVVDLSRGNPNANELLRWMSARKHTSGIPLIKIGGDDGIAKDQLAGAASAIAGGSP